MGTAPRYATPAADHAAADHAAGAQLGTAQGPVFGAFRAVGSLSAAGLGAAALLGLLGVSACDPGPALCPDGTPAPPSGECDDTDTLADTDTDASPTAKSADIRVEWTVEDSPNNGAMEVVCEGRSLASNDGYVNEGPYDLRLEALVGSRCFVRFSDTRGGRIPAGSVKNCSVEVGRWASVRSYAETVASFEVFACVPGCIDPVAENYDATANDDDGSCRYILGCTDPDAPNFDAAATRDDGSCAYEGFGVVQVDLALDANPSDTSLVVECDGLKVIDVPAVGGAFGTLTRSATVDRGFRCSVRVGDSAGDLGPGGAVKVCGDIIAEWQIMAPPPGQIGGVSYVSERANFLMPACSGCTDPAAPEYDPDALVNDGSCSPPEF